MSPLQQANNLPSGPNCSPPPVPSESSTASKEDQEDQEDQQTLTTSTSSGRRSRQGAADAGAGSLAPVTRDQEARRQQAVDADASLAESYRFEWVFDEVVAPSSLSEASQMAYRLRNSEDEWGQRRQTRRRPIFQIPGSLDHTRGIFCMLNPFRHELLYKLLQAPAANVEHYLEKLCYVENELQVAKTQRKMMYEHELQQILFVTASLGHDEASVQGTHLRRPLPEDEENLCFLERVAEVQLDFCIGAREAAEIFRQNYVDATIGLLRRQAKCVRILLLFRQVQRRRFWNSKALMSLMAELWELPYSELPHQFSVLYPCYDLALTITQQPPDVAETWLGAVADNVVYYTLLFNPWSPPAANAEEFNTEHRLVNESRQ
ncbi:hypothetical protein Efla_000414 [Eimeria flavescens]